MRFQIDSASLILGCNFTVSALFSFVFEGNLSSTTSGMALYLEGRFNGGFFALLCGGLIFEGAYTWRGLFSEFYGMSLVVGLRSNLFLNSQSGGPCLLASSLSPIERCWSGRDK